MTCPACGRRAPYRHENPLLHEVRPQCGGCDALLHFPNLALRAVPRDGRYAVVAVDPTDGAYPAALVALAFAHPALVPVADAALSDYARHLTVGRAVHFPY